MSSRSKEGPAGISRVEECLVTIIGIEGAIVARRARLPPTLFIRAATAHPIITIQDFFSFLKKNLNISVASHEKIHRSGPTVCALH